MALNSLGSGGVQNVKSFLQQPADKYGNDAAVETQWAMQAFHHAEVYFNLITTVDPTVLKLTPLDNEIYTDFRDRFKDLDVEKINEDEMKSTEGKAKWREFCEQYKGRVEDYNMGSLMRIDAKEEVNEHNTTLVPRIQFLAIEIARNREGYNSDLRKKFGVASKKKDSDENANKDKENPKTESS